MVNSRRKAEGLRATYLHTITGLGTLLPIFSPYSIIQLHQDEHHIITSRGPVIICYLLQVSVTNIMYTMVGPVLKLNAMVEIYHMYLKDSELWDQIVII